MALAQRRGHSFFSTKSRELRSIGRTGIVGLEEASAARSRVQWPVNVTFEVKSNAL